MASRKQFLVLRRAVLRALEVETPPAEVDRLFLECGLPIELFGIDLQANDATDRLASLADDLLVHAALVEEVDRAARD